MPLQWPHHLSMELSRCHYCGAVSYGQKVRADTPSLASLALNVPAEMVNRNDSV